MFERMKFYLEDVSEECSDSTTNGRNFINGARLAGDISASCGMAGVLLTSVSHLAFNTSSSSIRTAIAVTLSGFIVCAFGKAAKSFTREAWEPKLVPYLAGVVLGAGAITLGTGQLTNIWNASLVKKEQTVPSTVPALKVSLAPPSPL